MSFDPHEFDRDYAAGQQTDGLSRYALRTFVWMFLALGVTFLTAMGLYVSGAVYYVYAVPNISLVMLAAELAVVFFLSSRFGKLSVRAATALYFAYAVLNGVVCASLFAVYEASSLVLAFGAASLYFGAVAAYGYFTKADLSRLRTVLISGLVFLLVFSLLSLFIPDLSAFDRIACVIGIVLFLALTAYDTQKMKDYYEFFRNDEAMLGRASIYAALQLYLDFINLFLYLLRFLGRGKK